MHPLAASGRVNSEVAGIMIVSLVIAAVWGPFIGLGLPWILARRRRHPVWPNYWLWLLIEAGGAAADLLPPQQWPVLAIHMTSGAVAAYLWWRSRRSRRKRAPRAYGAKSRARIAQLAAGMRDAQRPRRVWQPQPGGAGW